MAQEAANQQLKEKAQHIGAKLIAGLEAAAKRSSEPGAAGALARGIIFQNAAFLEEAAQSFKEALAADPNAHEAGARLVLTLLRARRYDAALDVAAKLAKRAPDYAMPELTTDQSLSVFTLLGNALIANGRIDEAARAYEGALKRKPADTTAAARLAQVHIALGEPDKAFAHTKEILKNPRFSSLGSLLQLGRESAGLLSAFSPAGRLGSVSVDEHGRPFIVDGAIRQAEVIETDQWSNEPVALTPGR